MPHNQSYPTLKQTLCDPDAFATTLVVALIDLYGPDFVTWSPEAIRRITEEELGFTWPLANFDRLMAGVALVSTDFFRASLPDFIELCNVLAGSPTTHGQFDPADAKECAWGITEDLLLSQADDNEPYSEEICAYIGEVLKLEGIINPPDVLGIAHIDTNLRAVVHGNFSDDPELFASIWQNQNDKTEEINQLVRGRLKELLEQLAKLQLRNGDTVTIASRMLAGLQESEGGTPLP